MSELIDRIKKHKVWKRMVSLGEAIDQAVQREGIDPATIDGIERLRAVLAFTGKRLAGAEPVLVYPGPLDDIANALMSAQTELQAFVADGNAGHVVTANSQADTILSHLARVLVPLTPDDTGALKDAATAYRETIEAQLTLVRAAFAQVHAEGESQKARMNELTAEIAAERKRLSSVVSEFQAQFSSAQDTRGKENSDAQTARQEKFAALLADYQTKLTEQGAEFVRRREVDFKKHDEHVSGLTNKYEASAKTILDNIQTQKQQVEKLVGVIGNLGVTSGYLKTANHARIQTWIWQGITVASLVGMIWFAYRAFLPVLSGGITSADHQGGSFSWPGFAARLVLTLTVGVLAAYARSQADKHIEIERRNRKMALELEALGPYLAPLPPDKQNEFRLAVGDRSFGRDDLGNQRTSASPATLLDIGSDQLEKILAIVKALK